MSEQEIRQIYEGAGLKSKGTLDSFRARIRAYVRRNKGEAQERQLYEKAVRKGYVKSYLRSPPPFLFRLAPVERKGVWGPADAPIHIIEFSDFQ